MNQAKARTRSKTALKKPLAGKVIPDSLIDKVQERLASGKPVRRTLPLDGRIHIDRTLPFIVLYRRPRNRPDDGTDRLVKSVASYIIASDDPKMKPSLVKLIQSVVSNLTEQCGSFLIIEIFTSLAKEVNIEDATSLQKPEFNIIAPSKRFPTKTVQVFQKALNRIKILKQSSVATVLTTKERIPRGLSPMIKATDAAKLKCFSLSVEIKPVFRNPNSGDVFPFVLRRMQRGFDVAIKRTAFEFSRTHTSHNPKSYLALGRRSVVNAVWKIDKQLATISNAFDFLLNVTPVNTDSAWALFKRYRFERVPELKYRPLPIDPALYKRKLFSIPIESVEDPTLAHLFRENQLELDRKLTMLWDRGTPEFLHGSRQLFGGGEKELVDIAKDILTKLKPRKRGESDKNSINAREFAKVAQNELDFYRQTNPDLTSRVEIRDDIVGLMVSQGNLLIGKQMMIPVPRVEALIQHEVGTHILTYYNGRSQPLQLLYCGLPGYEELQEGLAVLSEYFVGGLNSARLRLLAGRVIAANCIISGASFVETYRLLNQEYGFNQRSSFTITVRIFRGGGLTKDAVYLRGLVQLLEYLKKGGDLNPLFVGKIATHQISMIQELQHRQILRPITLFPRYIGTIKEKLITLKSGLGPLNLIQRSK